MLVGTGRQNIRGSPVKAKANTLEKCCCPGCPEARSKTASHTLVSILLFPYLPALRIPLLRILSYLFIAIQVSSRLLVLHSKTAWYEQPLLEKEKEER